MSQAEDYEDDVIDGEVVESEEDIETLEDDDLEEVDDQLDEEPSDETEEVSEEDEAEEVDDEVIVTIGDESPPSDEEDDKEAPGWVTELRKAHRETQKEVKALREENERLKNPKQEVVELGPKPKLEDYDYDADEFETALDEWKEKKRESDEIQRRKDDEAQQAQQDWQERLNAYAESKSSLKVKNFDEAEDLVLEQLDQTQQGIIVQGADNSALVVLALGKNPKRLEEVAQIKDPVKFAFAVAKLEKDLKVTNKKAPPPPEKKVETNGSGKTSAVDSTLARLRKEASETGDFSKLNAYKRKLKKSQQ